jgi:hypothetical protein
MQILFYIVGGIGFWVAFGTFFYGICNVCERVEAKLNCDHQLFIVYKGGNSSCIMPIKTTRKRAKDNYGLASHDSWSVTQAGRYACVDEVKRLSARYGVRYDLDCHGFAGDDQAILRPLGVMRINTGSLSDNRVKTIGWKSQSIQNRCRNDNDA